MRCGALERYMDLVLKINGDLTKRIADTAEARAHLRSVKYIVFIDHNF